MKNVIRVYAILRTSYKYFHESKSIDTITNCDTNRLHVSLNKTSDIIRGISDRLANDIANGFYSEQYLILYIGYQYLRTGKKMKITDYKSEDIKSFTQLLTPESMRNAKHTLAEVFDATGLDISKLTKLNATGTSFLTKMFDDNILPISSIMYLIHNKMIKPIKCERHNKILTTVTKMVDVIKYYKQGA